MVERELDVRLAERVFVSGKVHLGLHGPEEIDEDGGSSADLHVQRHLGMIQKHLFSVVGVFIQSLHVEVLGAAAVLDSCLHQFAPVLRCDVAVELGEDHDAVEQDAQKQGVSQGKFLLTAGVVCPKVDGIGVREVLLDVIAVVPVGIHLPHLVLLQFVPLGCGAANPVVVESHPFCRVQLVGKGLEPAVREKSQYMQFESLDQSTHLGEEQTAAAKQVDVAKATQRSHSEERTGTQTLSDTWW